MNHFVSASCGEPCVCGRPSTHKIGEELMSDEPCMSCGQKFISDAINPEGAAAARERCKSFFHIGGPGAQRHNLTAYVCCLCFTRLLGKATGCPLTADEQKSLDNYRYAHAETGFSPTCELMCPACDIGRLEILSVNETNVVIGCLNCGCGSHIENEGKFPHVPSRDPGNPPTDQAAQEGTEGPGKDPG